ncbi:ROK family protein [Phaeobacter sp. C3_T13_0]|uniref:ROK family protein n=1 Tax=Phaeobacter cretensis TaxID=3342641 RepID=UPI0039BD6ECA
MSAHRLEQDQGTRNRNRVIAEILRRPGLSRTDIGNAVGLNVASVSRITRDLIDANLIRESDAFGPKGRPGRRFVGLKPNGDGGYIIGIGLNAFRQSVTLADLENRKIAEWVSSDTPDKDGEAFMRLCLAQAAEMLGDHVTDRSRFFGVGIAVAAELSRDRSQILRAPVFGWDKPIAIAEIVREVLEAPLVLDTPTSAINKAEAEQGLGIGFANLTTLYCSLGFGIGIRQQGDDNGAGQEFGRVLTESKAPDGSGRTLSQACGGLSLLEVTRGSVALSGQPDATLSAMLVEDVVRAVNDAQIQALLRERGKRTAEYFALVLEVGQPERVLLAGALAKSPDFVSGFQQALKTCLGHPDRRPDVRCSDMTPTGASRWLSLRDNVAMGNLDLASLKQETTA